MFDCCDDKKYAKFLRFVKREESRYYPIYNIGTILDRVPLYSNYEQLFSAGIDEILDNYEKFKYTINQIPKALIKLCKKRINKQYECSFGDYIFIYPESTQDIKDEAASQNNCVASYIDKVIDGQCHILFLRKKNKPDESLVTIEVRNNHIVQARRRFNDDVTAEDQKAIDAFNKKFANKEDKVA